MSRIVVRPITEDLVRAIRDFNSRLDDGGAPPQFRFPECHISTWLPKVAHRRLYEEYFALSEKDTIRGCYIFKHQDFSFHGVTRSIGFWHWPISEGVVNNKYSWVASRMLETGLKAQPLLYGLNMTDQLARLLTILGWSLCRVPLYFKVNRPGRFLAEIRVLRQTKARQLIANLAAGTGIGGLALKILQSGREAGGPLDEQAEVVRGFSGWADDLWDACKGSYAMIGVRDRETLNILYPPSSERFLCYKVVRASAVIGWAVLLDTQMRDNKHFGNLRVGSIVDCLASPEQAFAVVRAATQVLEARGVDLIVSNQSHAAWCAALRSAGFQPGPSNFRFAASRELAKLLDPLPTTMAQIHVTRADGAGPLNL
ncbi:MAG: hypothetical protein JOZ08_00335 [Verrucomicrobia bacterium]|nr:hypothetical protein [Verrucomicrobiota bacterium]MBV8279752.1 hypothetical protein [Verrucomicrobiota bacterium]